MKQCLRVVSIRAATHLASMRSENLAKVRKRFRATFQIFLAADFKPSRSSQQKSVCVAAAVISPNLRAFA